jgi:hypothetical protein
MSIIGDIEKLITEHGSASILREKVGLLDLQRTTAVAERDSLALQLAQARSKIDRLEADTAQLQAERDEARHQIQHLKQSSDGRLPDESEKMLVLIANAPKGLTSAQVIHHLGLAQAKGEYFFDQVTKRKLVHASTARVGVGWFYYATQAGREYLAHNGLL